MDAKTLRREFREGRTGQRMVAVVLHHPNRTGKTYRLATEADVEVFRRAEAALLDRSDDLSRHYEALSPVPDEPLRRVPVTFGVINVWVYGMTTWGDLFNARQKLALITFVDKVRRAHKEMLAEGYDLEYAKAVVTYLGLMLSRVADFCNNLSSWLTNWQFCSHLFARQAIPMVWDYSELNPFSSITGTWEGMLRKTPPMVEHASKASDTTAQVSQGTATRLPYPNDHFDAVFTDPPYYDNVPYAYLADFFYVWLKRSVGRLYPDLFATPLTPKGEEIVAYSLEEGGAEAGRLRFEERLAQAFQEIHRVLKPGGIAVIVFAHKSTDAWETIIQSLLRAGLVLTASWPVHTEMKARLRGQESAALASSIYMVCRKRVEEKVAYFNEIRPAIEERIRERLEHFWNAGIGGADFFISAIGPAVEVFGQYARVERLSGEEVTVKELLEYVRRVVSEFALERILRGGHLAGVDPETRFYLLWRWTYKALRAHFDDARKLAQAVGVELTEQWGRGGFIRKEKEYIRVLGPLERAKELVEVRFRSILEKKSTMIDILHLCLISWALGQRKFITDLLRLTGYGGLDFFWQVAQAISEVLPEGNKERQLLQGFLYGRREYEKAARMAAEQLKMEFG
jgi:adenine-specific DNA methylase